MAKTFEGVIFDEHFVLEKELRSLGFRKSDIEGEYLRVVDWVHADFSDELDDDLVSARRQVAVWRTKLRKLLSRPVGKYAHKRRPHRNLLPMLNSAELRESIKVKLKQPNNTIWSYELSINLKSNHANLTNENITSRGRNGRRVAWRGWADEMLEGRGLKGVTSARNLMRSLFR